jgi:hypothetical protein
MFRRQLTTQILLIFFAAACWAQTMYLEPYGISPRDADNDLVDVFDRPYNGLLNVGIETKMYLKGYLSGSVLTTPVWTVTAPVGANNSIIETVDFDASTQIAVFVPDSIGTYTIEFTDGSYSASVIVNASTYIGIGGACELCHTTQKFEWEGTGHYSFFESALNGIKSAHYAFECIGCHTTGYDESANNNGFDDRQFVFPDSLYSGQWENMLAQYPDAMNLARIQCESCHGPGDAHDMGNSSSSEIVIDLSSDVCAICHDSGYQHFYPEQWDFSAHSKASISLGRDRAPCQDCHTGEGFVRGGVEIEQPYSPISCSACHDPHSATNQHQLRRLDAQLANGETITEGGNGKLCMNCHQSRRDGVDYVDAYLLNLGSHFGPHFSTQADMMLSTNVPTFEQTLPSTPHITANDNSCINCHMASVPFQEEIPLAGSHTFAVSDSVNGDNVAVCEQCHINVGDSFDDMKYFLVNNADHDGDGLEEGLQLEVQGLLDSLAMLLPKNAQQEVEISNPSVTLDEAKAAYNYFFVKADNSLGIHNPAFTVALLQVSIQALNSTKNITTPSILSGPSSAKVGQSISFMTGGSTSDSGFVLEYRFDWGDGTRSAWGDSTRNHMFVNTGSYSIRSLRYNRNIKLVIGAQYCSHRTFIKYYDKRFRKRIKGTQ